MQIPKSRIRGIQRAIAELQQFAMDYCINPEFVAEQSDAKLISAGLSAAINHDTSMSLDIAANLAEDVNYQRMAEIIRKWDDHTVEELVEIMK